MTDTPQSRESAEPLRFAVVDHDDLAVVSAHLQDALLSLADVAFLSKTKRFALVVSRVDWSGFGQGKLQRRRTGFHFERVMRVQRSGFDDDKGEYQLLSVEFTPAAAPAGAVKLTFAGGHRIRLEVECLEAEMRDLGDGWVVTSCPRHHLDEATPPV